MRVFWLECNNSPLVVPKPCSHMSFAIILCNIWLFPLPFHQQGSLLSVTFKQGLIFLVPFRNEATATSTIFCGIFWLTCMNTLKFSPYQLRFIIMIVSIFIYFTFLRCFFPPDDARLFLDDAILVPNPNFHAQWIRIIAHQGSHQMSLVLGHQSVTFCFVSLTCTVMFQQVKDYWSRQIPVQIYTKVKIKNKTWI